MNHLRIKEVCKQRKITGEKLAELIKVSKTTISQINSGAQKPSFDTLAKIAKVLDVDIKDLFVSTKETIHLIINNDLKTFRGLQELKEYVDSSLL